MFLITIYQKRNSCKEGISLLINNVRKKYDISKTNGQITICQITIGQITKCQKNGKINFCNKGCRFTQKNCAMSNFTDIYLNVIIWDFII